VDNLAKREKLTAEWRKVHNEELCDLYCTPNIIRVIKYKRVRWAVHVVRMRKKKDAYRVWWGKLRVRAHKEDLGIDGGIILKSMFKKWICA
jgi:hypothetical protein